MKHIMITEPNGGRHIGEIDFERIDVRGLDIWLTGMATSELVALLGDGYMEQMFDLVTDDGRVRTCRIIESGGGRMRLRAFGP